MRECACHRLRPSTGACDHVLAAMQGTPPHLDVVRGKREFRGPTSVRCTIYLRCLAVVWQANRNQYTGAFP
eukprot:152044-Chlamydomonas_euryale.AAC.2